MNNNEKIVVLLKRVGVTPAHRGWEYLIEAITMVVEDPTAINGITKIIYPTIAKKYDATPNAVEKAIRHSIGKAFEILPQSVKYEIFGNTVGYGKVTNGEFIGILAELITTEPNNPIWTIERNEG